MIQAEYVLYFLIYGFLGWIYESLYYSVQFKKPVNTGFLHICFCPIYGVVCILNLLLFSGHKSDIKIFFSSMAVVSAVEYIVSWLLEKKFAKRWWDYSELPFNLNGRISLFSSLAFGALSLLQLRVVHPFISQFIARFDERAIKLVSLVAFFVIATDFVRTLAGMKNMDDERLWFVNEESPAMHKATTKFNEKTHKVSEKCNRVYTQIRDKVDR